MEKFHQIALIASELMAIVTLLAFLVRPLRERIFADKAAREGMQCLLRSEIVRTYYRHLDDKQMREYEFENLSKCYKAYTKNGGNSFVKHIYEEMETWTIVP
jgi:hypothetical protein